MSEEQTRDYVVLQKTLAVVGLPEGADSVTGLPVVETWVPIMEPLLDPEDPTTTKVATFNARDDDHAVELYAGEPVEKPGTYKAISWRNWSGAITKKPAVVTDTQKTNDE